ncbi:uncharacterized protein TNCV_2115191 [Trichonephila clavipes]|nr:uncharacterized protein TNCV_2115191 [Trichonephila clavipes]
MVSFNLTIGAVEPHHLSQCLDPAEDLDGVFFHPKLPVHVNKQAALPAYLKQLALERIGDIPIDAVQNPEEKSRDGCSVFRSELIAIEQALGSIASLPNGKEICILYEIMEVQYRTCTIGKVKYDKNSMGKGLHRLSDTVSTDCQAERSEFDDCIVSEPNFER